jgi:hypothetical protein
MNIILSLRPGSPMVGRTQAVVGSGSSGCENSRPRPKLTESWSGQHDTVW